MYSEFSGIIIHDNCVFEWGNFSYDFMELEVLLSKQES